MCTCPGWTFNCFETEEDEEEGEDDDDDDDEDDEDDDDDDDDDDDRRYLALACSAAHRFVIGQKPSQC